MTPQSSVEKINSSNLNAPKSSPKLIYNSPKTSDASKKLFVNKIIKIAENAVSQIKEECQKYIYEETILLSSQQDCQDNKVKKVQNDCQKVIDFADIKKEPGSNVTSNEKVNLLLLYFAKFYYLHN